VPGGAGRTKWTAIQMATALTSRTGPSDAARSRHEIRWIRREKRSGAFSRVPPSSTIRLLPAAWRKEWPRRTPRSAVGAGHVQPRGRANESLQCRLVDLLALVEVDGTPGVAIEARVEEACWVLEGGPLGEGHLHDTLVGLAGADQSVVRPYRNPSPLPLLDHLGVGLLDQCAEPGAHLCPPSSQLLD